MVNAARILTSAAREAVRDIDQPYDGYDVELVRTFTRVLQILRNEPSNQAQRREIETLLQGLASEVNAKSEDT